MYKLAKLKLDDEGNWIYECEWEYATWADLMVDVAYRTEHANTVLYGHGSHILHDGTVLGTLADLNRIEKPYLLISETEFLAQVAD